MGELRGGATTGIGGVRAFFEADTKGFDASVKGTTAQLKAAAQAADLAGDRISAAGSKIDRAAQQQERAAERARRAWQREQIEQDRASQRDAESARAKEMAALKADILSRSLEKQGAAQMFVNEATAHSIPQMSAASAAVRALEGNMTHNIRAAERFVSTTLGLAPILEKAFPVVGAVALGAAAAGVVGELIDLGRAAEDLSQELGTNWLDAAMLQLGGFGKKVKEQVDLLQQFRQELDQTTEQRKESAFQMIGMKEGKEAEAAARSQAMLQQAAGMESMVPSLRARLAAAQELATPLGASSDRAAAIQRRATLREQYGFSTNTELVRPIADAAAEQLAATTAQITKIREDARKLVLEPVINAGKGKTGDPAKADRTAEHELVQQWEHEFKARDARGLMTARQELSFWMERAGKVKEGSVAYLAAIDKADDVSIAAAKKTSEGLAAIRKKAVEFVRATGTTAVPAGLTLSSGGTLGLFSTSNEALLAAQAKAAQAQAAITAEWQATVDKIGLVTGKVTPLTAAMDEQARHAEEYRLQLAALREQLAALQAGDALAATLGGDPALAAKELQVRTQIAELEGKARSQALIDQQATLAQTWTGMVDTVWDEMIRKANDTANQIRQIATQFVDGINSQAAKAITGGHADFGSVFRSASEGLAKTGLEKLEGSLLKGFGLGTKADGSAGSPFHVLVDNGSGVPDTLASLFKGKSPNITGPGGASSLVNGAGSGLLGMLNDSNWLSSLFGGKLFGAGSLFGGLKGFADGGPIPSNLPSIVGERGPELFLPSTPGRIVPNHQLGGLGGGQTVMHIDARGTDPSLTRANFEQSLRATYAAAVSHAQHSMADRQRRVPR